MCGFCFSSSVNATLGSPIALIQAVDSIPQISIDSFFFYNFLRLWKCSHLSLRWNWTSRREGKGEASSQPTMAVGSRWACTGVVVVLGLNTHQPEKELDPFCVLHESPAWLFLRWLLFCFTEVFPSLAS